MDGARLWEAVAARASTLDDPCTLDDSVNLCLTKGLGAPVGSILLGGYDFIRAAKWVRKSVGGAMRQLGLMAAAIWAAVYEAFRRDPSGKDSLFRMIHEHASRVVQFR